VGCEHLLPGLGDGLLVFMILSFVVQTINRYAKEGHCDDWQD
jgi:hypothetical protein